MLCVRDVSRKRYEQPFFVFEDVEGNGSQQKSSCQWLWSERTYCVLKAMAKLTLIMAYFFVCDR